MNANDALSTNDTSRTARQVHEDIEHALGAQEEDLLSRGGKRVWHVMKCHPFLSAAALAACGVAAAVAVGAAELTFGTALAFAAYKVLREGEPPIEALEDIEHVG